MKTRTFVLIHSVVMCLTLNAQKKYEKIYYSVAVSENTDMLITVKDAISTKALTKFNLKINNKGNDILIYKPEESKLKTGTNELSPIERRLEVFPAGSDSRVINFDGKDFLIPNYSFEVNGVYKISDTDQAIETANYQLPPQHNEFKTGNFICTMINLEKETAKTSVKFECRYTGNKFGVINPSRTAIKLPDGSEIANSKSAQKAMVLAKGESETFTLVWKRMEGGSATDMQKINLQILWRATFVESEVVKLSPVILDFKIDEARSK